MFYFQYYGLLSYTMCFIYFGFCLTNASLSTQTVDQMDTDKWTDLVLVIDFVTGCLQMWSFVVEAVAVPKLDDKQNAKNYFMVLLFGLIKHSTKSGGSLDGCLFVFSQND